MAHQEFDPSALLDALTDRPGVEGQAGRVARCAKRLGVEESIAETWGSSKCARSRRCPRAPLLTMDELSVHPFIEGPWQPCRGQGTRRRSAESVEGECR